MGVKLDKAAPSDLALAYTVGGTATAGSDFTIANSGTLSVPKGATTATIPVTIIDDSVEDGGETVVLTLTAGNGYAVVSPNTHTLTIQNHEPAVPTVTVARKAGTASSISEGGKAAFTVTRSAASATPLTVSLDVSEAAGSDFVAAGDEGTRDVTVPADATEVTFEVATVGDTTDEPDGSVTVTVTDGDGLHGRRSRVGQRDRARRRRPLAGLHRLSNGGELPHRGAGQSEEHGRERPSRAYRQVEPGAEAVGHDTGTGVAPMAASVIHANAAQWPDSPFKAASVYLKSQEQQQEPAVTVSAGTSPVTEGGSATFTLTATPPPRRTWR